MPVFAMMRLVQELNELHPDSSMQISLLCSTLCSIPLSTCVGHTPKCVPQDVTAAPLTYFEQHVLITDRHKRAIQDTWQQMEKLVEEGLVKTIGISNFSVKKIEDLLQYAKITPAVNQVELHPYFRNEKLHKYCDSKVSAHPHCLNVRHCQFQHVCF